MQVNVDPSQLLKKNKLYKKELKELRSKQHN